MDLTHGLTKEHIDELFDEKNYSHPNPPQGHPLEYIRLTWSLMEEKVMEIQKVEGFPVRPMHDYIYVADLGQPNLTEGGVWLPDEAFKFARYKHLNERYGIVVAIGKGRLMNPGESSLCKQCSSPCKKGKTVRCPKLPALFDEGLELGSTVLFNRRFGSRLGYMFQPEEFAHPLYVRVLDPDKVLALVEGFEPWWDTERGVLHPDLVMSG